MLPDLNILHWTEFQKCTVLASLLNLIISLTQMRLSNQANLLHTGILGHVFPKFSEGSDNGNLTTLLSHLRSRASAVRPAMDTAT